MKIPYDRVLAQPFQYNQNNFDHVPEVEGYGKAFVHDAAIMVANLAGAQALVNPARTYCFNVLCQNAWHNADFDTIVDMVCKVSAKKAKLGGFISPEAALHTSAEEVLMLYTCSLVMGHEGVRQACQPSVKHTAAQNIAAWLSLKQEFPTMNNPQYMIQIVGYNQAGQPLDQYGQIVPPHLLPQQAPMVHNPYVHPGQHMVGVNGHPMTYVHPGQPVGTYAPNSMPVFSGAPNPAALQNPGQAQPQQQPQQLYAQRPPSQYIRPNQHQVAAPAPAPVYQQQQITQLPPVGSEQQIQAPVAAPAPTYQQQQPQVQAQPAATTPRASNHTHLPENRVLVASNISILENPVERARHMLAPMHENQPRPAAAFGGGLAELGQVHVAAAFTKELHDAGKIVKRRNEFGDNVVYASSVQELGSLITQYSKGAQFVDSLDKQPFVPEINTLIGVVLNPIFTFFGVKQAYDTLASSKEFKEYLSRAREFCKGYEEELKATTDAETLMAWQDNIVFVETIDRIMTDSLNLFLFQSLHITTSVESLLGDYEELIAYLSANSSVGTVRDVNDHILKVFKNIFSVVDDDQKSMFVAEHETRPGVENIDLTLIPTTVTLTYVPLLTRTLGVKLRNEFQKVLPTGTANLYKLIKEVFANIDQYQASGKQQTPIMNSYIVMDDGVLLQIYRSTNRSDSVYIRTVM